MTFLKRIGLLKQGLDEGSLHNYGDFITGLYCSIITVTSNQTVIDVDLPFTLRLGVGTH